MSIVEAMDLGEKLGMDPILLKDVMSKCTSNCWSLNTSNPLPGVIKNAPSNWNYENGFSCELMAKDLNLSI